MSAYDPVGPEKDDPLAPIATDPGFGAEPPEKQEKKGPGCVFWGCLIVGILGLLFAILVIVAIFAIRGAAINFLEENSEPQPAELPEVTLTEEQERDVLQRWDEFKDAADQGESRTLELTGDEFNAVVFREEPEAKQYIHFEVEGDTLTGQVSVPVEKVGGFLRTGKLDGRYFNAKGTFDISLRDGVLYIYLTDAELKGEPVPDQFLQGIRAQNLAEDAMKDPDAAELFRQFESIEVKDGKIILTSEGADATEAEAEAEAVDVEGQDSDGAEDEPVEEEPADGLDEADGEPVDDADGEPVGDGEDDGEPVGDAVEEPVGDGASS